MPSNNSPLRYPGGKSQLFKYISHTLEMNHLDHATYCEAFCGGAGVAMSLLLNNKVNQVLLNDYDPAIYSVWYAILHQADELIENILDTPVTLDEWYNQRAIYNRLKVIRGYNFDLAWATFYLNRTNRSGIIEGGPIGGLTQTAKYKIDCRFNKPSLIKKIQKIHALRNRIHLYNYDGIEFIRRVIEPFQGNIFIFFDPPYFKQGKNLYKNALDATYHAELSQAICNLQRQHWIVTYDNVDEIRTLYADCEGWRYKVRYTANEKRRESELLYKSPITQLESYERVTLEEI